MIRNYLTVGLRALAKNRTYAVINIVGLALGLAAAVMILLYVRYEMSYDAWLPGADQAFELQDYYKADKKGTEAMPMQMSPYVAGQALRKDFPQIEKIVYIKSADPVVLQDGVAKKTDEIRIVDGNIFDILQFPFVRGNPAHVLDDTHSLAISEKEAIRRFGTVNAVGKTLTLQLHQGDVDYRITGVFKDIPKNSQFAADMVARADIQAEVRQFGNFLTSWGSQGGWYYVKLRKGASADEINAQLPAWKKRNIPDDVTNGERTNQGDLQDFALVNVRDVHLGKGQRFGIRPTNDRRTVLTFGLVALMVLGMACVNFTNLATARASQRAREVALRKVLGATRRQLVTQFIGESILVAGIAMLIALALVELLLPVFNAFLNADIALHYFGRDTVLPYLVLLVLLVGAAGGVYPAFYLTRFEPARVLRANKSAAEAQGSGLLRNILVVGQFAVSIALIICTVVIYAQTIYARTADQGYQREGLFQVSNMNAQGVDKVALRLVDQIRRLPGVQAAAATGIALQPNNNNMTGVFLPGSTSSITIGDYTVQAGFFRAMGMKLLAGRDFDENRPRDDATTPIPADMNAERAFAARGANVIVSESASRRLGFRTPQEALGKTMTAGITLREIGLVPVTIIGVVQDARFRSMHDPLQPIMFLMAKNNFTHIDIRYAGIAPNRLRDEVQGVWNRLLPQVPFQGDFADDILRDEYKADTARGQLFAGFAFLSVVVGCLGLFGLASFTAERRTKEIGIRKVLGARTRDIVRLLVWQFSRPVLVANMIAWPIAWWAMRDWLDKFDQRIGLGPTPFLLAGGLALGIAIATISSHAFRVARANPILALRYE
jgi:putative ABC transport system permease protein